MFVKLDEKYPAQACCFPTQAKLGWGTQRRADCGFFEIGGEEFRDGTGFPRIQATRR